MELGHSVNPSHWEVQVNDKQDLISIVVLCFYYCCLFLCFVSTGSPQLVTVTAVNSTTVTVSWSEIQCFNGSGAVTHYLVQYQSMCGGAVQNVTTGGPVQTVSGLTPNVAVYTFRVAAVGASQNIGPFRNPANVSLHGELGVGCNH